MLLEIVLAKTQATVSFKKLFQGLVVAFSTPQIWLVAIYGLLMFGPTISFCSLWGVPFIQMKYALSKQDAAFFSSLIFFGWIIGSPICGYISDTIHKRLPTMIYGTIFALLSMSAIIYAPLSNVMLFITLIIFGISSSGFLTAFSIVREISPQHCSASVLSFMNTMNSLGPAILTPLVGKLLALTWTGKMLAGNIPDYGLGEYSIAMATLPGTIFLAMCLLPFIKETNCKIIHH